MKSCLLASALLVLTVCNAVSAAERAANTPVEEQVVQARKKLDAWHEGQQQPGQRKLHIICWTPSDRELPANYESRLDAILKRIQAFYASEMERHGFGPRSINLSLNEQGRVKLFAVTGRHPTEHYGKQSGREIREECLPVLAEAGLNADEETIVIFCNLADWNAERLRFSHRSPYYAGGTNRSGTAWQLDSPELDVLNIPKKQPLIIDGEYGRISLGKHNSIFIGGIAHELGHALSLPHCKPRPDEAVLGTPLMGSGNRTFGDEERGEGKGTILSFAHALKLASHPQFSESVKGMDVTPSLDLSELQITSDDRSISVSGKVTGSPPVYGVLAYFDPAGGGDYDSTTMTAIPAADGSFSFSTDALQPGKPAELRIVPLHCNGASSNARRNTSLRFSYSVDAAGRPDVSVAQARLELVPFLDAFSARQQQKAISLAGNLESELAGRIAQRLLNPVERTSSPAEIDQAATQVLLSQCLPEQEQVGWMRPVYDRLPGAEPMLAAGDRLFETGLYAHAPASHVYRLDGRWKKLEGFAGIAAGKNGSVQFEVKVDGKTRWKSRILRGGELIAFEVDLTGGKQLELLTHPTDDGANSDWGLWLEPTLSR